MTVGTHMIEDRYRRPITHSIPPVFDISPHLQRKYTLAGLRVGIGPVTIHELPFFTTSYNVPPFNGRSVFVSEPHIPLQLMTLEYGSNMDEETKVYILKNLMVPEEDIVYASTHQATDILLGCTIGDNLQQYHKVLDMMTKNPTFRTEYSLAVSRVLYAHV